MPSAEMIRLVAVSHADYPLPDNVTEAAVLWIDASESITPVEPDEIRDVLREYLMGVPHVANDTYSEFSWGGAGASLGLVYHVSTLIGGVAGVVYLVDRMRAVAAANGWKVSERRHTLSVEHAMSEARQAVASAIEGSPREVVVAQVEPTPWGFRVKCATPVGDFIVEIKGDLVHVERVSARDVL